MKPIAVCFFLLLVSSICVANDSRVFSTKSFLEGCLISKDPSTYVLAKHLLEGYGDRPGDLIIDRYLKEIFVAEKRPFIIIDSRLTSGEVALFSLNAPPGGKEIDDLLHIYSVHEGYEEQTWAYALQLGELMSREQFIYDRSSGSGSVKAVFVLSYDGKNFYRSTYVGWSAFVSGQASDQKAFMKYSQFFQLIRCLLFSTKWNDKTLRSNAMLMMEGDYELIEEYCSSKSLKK